LSARFRPEQAPSNHVLKTWAFVGIIIWVVIGAGLIIRGLGEILSMLMASLGPFLVAGLLVTLVRPVTHRLKDAGMSDGFSALIGTLVAIIGIVALTTLFAGPVVSGAVGFFSTLPDSVNRINGQLQTAVSQYNRLSPVMRTQIEALLQAFGSWAAGWAGNAVGVVLSGLSGIFNAGLSLFMGLILTFWFLKDGPKISKALVAVAPESIRDDVCLVGSSFDSSFSGYLVATAINVLVIFVLDGLGFSAIHLPYGWFVAAMIGIVGVIPFVGSILSAVIAVIVGLTVGVQTGVITGVIVFAVDQIVYSFLGPIVAGRVVTLHPVAIILALAVGASLGGFLGAVLAMPTAAAIRTIYVFYRDKHAAQRRAELQARAPATGDADA
jgi:predicted PurR-regulated permease PerM